jgi:hypothetical protein
MGIFSNIIDFLKSVTLKDQINPTFIYNEVNDINDNYQIGLLTKKYECSNKGPGYISNGSKWGDPGGDSYGSYQLETKKGTMQEYLTRVDDKFTEALRALKINSDSFKSKWKDIALKDPVGFEQSQFNYLANKKNGYYDGIKYAKNLGWNTDNLAMKSAIFSAVNQSGGWKTFFDKTGIIKTDSLDVQINKLYDARANYFKKLNLTKNVKDSIIKNRTVDERKDCLTLIGRK